MNDQTRITAAEARFPLAQLTLSPLNPRQNVPEAEVVELAESLLTAGLIQNLAGIANDEGGAEIVAGGRRLRALQYLAEQHPDLERERPDLANPPVRLAPDETTAQAWAVAENAARRDLHPADEIRAYGRMERSGATPAVIARAFAVTERHVYRRLALAGLPAPVIDALAANEISLSMAACFTISADETRSLEVLETCRGEAWNDYRLKKALKPDAVTDSDRRVCFTGLDVYKAAGGRVSGDLFAEETLLDDPDILDAVFAEKLAEVAENRRGEGWKWIDTHADSYVGWYVIEEAKLSRLYREEGVLSEAQVTRYDDLASLANGDALDAEGEAELEAITEGDWSAAQKAHAGVILYVDSSGALQAVEGLVRREDKAAAIDAGVLQPSQHPDADAAPKSPISTKLAEDLARVAQGARQHAMLRNPDLLIDLLAYQLSHQLHWMAPLGVTLTEVPNWPTTEAEGYALDPRLSKEPPRDMYGKDLAKSFRAFRKKGPEHVKGELARFLAAQYRGGSAELATLLEKETGPRIREIWTPSAANFFSRVGGVYLNDLWNALLDLSADDTAAVSFAKLKKSEKAAKLESLFTDAATREAHGVTEEQAERIANWLPEGMA